MCHSRTLYLFFGRLLALMPGLGILVMGLWPQIGLPQQVPCYAAPTTIATVPASGRVSSFLIYKLPSCAWFQVNGAVSNDNWITIQKDEWWGYDNAGTFAFAVSQNGGSARIGTVSLAGITFTIRQLGASDAIPVTGLPSPNLAILDSMMTGDMREFGAPGGALAVSYKGRIVYARGFGYADLATLELVQPDSLFRLASVSKLITMAAINNLVQKGQINLSSMAFTVLSNIGPPPGLSVVDPRWYSITINELINHTGGFLRTSVDRSLTFSFFKSATTALGEPMPGDNSAVIRYAMSQPLDYTPGSPPSPCPDCYSNFGYQILGRVIEKVTGTTYEDYIRNVIMTPAGVSRTRAARSFPEQAAPGEVKYYASPSEMWGDSAFASTPGPALTTYGEFPYENMDSFGGMISNTTDLLRFYIHWLNWGPGSGFYGALPGTNTGVFTLATNNDIKYAFLFNYRSDHNRVTTAFCTVANPCTLETAVQNDIEKALAGFANWPTVDLTSLYSGSSPACSFAVTPSSPTYSSAPQGGSVNVTVNGTNCPWTMVSDQPWVSMSGGPQTGSATANFSLAANTTGVSRATIVYVAGQPIAITQSAFNTQVSGLSFVAVTPCRIADTRSPTGFFGGPSLVGNSTRDFAIPSSPCGIPATARAYSLNVTVVPHGVLNYLTMYPAGGPVHAVSTLNSIDGRVKANAAIIPAGTNGAISVYVTDTTDVILDINGYFVPSNGTSNLAFYPVPPCRISDTRNASGPFGGPTLQSGQTRTIPVPGSGCGIPSVAQAYSLNFTVVPTGPLGYLSTWPSGSLQPLVSTLNSPTGAVTANAAIVPAGAGGAIDVYVTNHTEVIVDINGYFAPPGGANALSFYAVDPCRISDTRDPVGPFGGPSLGAGLARTYTVTAGSCGLPATAKAYSLNATVVPKGPLGYLTLWPAAAAQPFVSTLNAGDGAITSNAAIVPGGINGAISAYATNATDLVLDVNGYFAP
jgi:CubicO group peptidase (beta-lactamase class C family)